MFSSFLNIFASSPIKPLEKHVDEAAGAVSALNDFIGCVVKQNWQQAEQCYHLIRQAESRADEIKRTLRLHLPSTLFMPVPRSDILELLSAQESIANKAKDIAGLMWGRQMGFPSEVSTGLLNFVARCKDATEKAKQVIYELDSLLETGFRGHEIGVVEGMVTELDLVEKDTDVLQIELRRGLFKIESTLNPIDVMFMYRIIEMIGELADGAQRVGHRLQQLVAH